MTTGSYRLVLIWSAYCSYEVWREPVSCLVERFAMERVLMKKVRPLMVRVGSGSIAALVKIAKADDVVDSNPVQTATICSGESGRSYGRNMIEKKNVCWSYK